MLGYKKRVWGQTNKVFALKICSREIAQTENKEEQPLVHVAHHFDLIIRYKTYQNISKGMKVSLQFIKWR